jgi:hypothetical protein
MGMLSINLFEREPVKPPLPPSGISGTALDNEEPILHPAWSILQASFECVPFYSTIDVLQLIFEVLLRVVVSADLTPRKGKRFFGKTFLRKVMVHILMTEHISLVCMCKSFLHSLKAMTPE